MSEISSLLTGGRTLLLDGAAGTLLQPRGAECADMLCLTHPHRVADMHRAYLQAGADIIETNTCNANPLSLRRYEASTLMRDLNMKAASLARKEADRASEITPEKPRLVAGAIGPTEVALSRPEASVSAASLTEAFAAQGAALIEGGVDLLLLETFYDLRNATAAMQGVLQARSVTGRDVPFILSAVPAGPGGSLPSGHTLSQLAEAAAPFGPLALGLNCCDSACLCAHAATLANLTALPLLLYPNAGIPDSAGHYPDTPATWVRPLLPLLQHSTVAIAGGCCGTTPEYIRLLAQKATGSHCSKWSIK